VATDDLSVARGGRYIVDAATEKTLTLPATINPGYEIEIVNQGAGGFNLLTNDGQKLRDADTEYGPGVVQLESIDPYTAVRLMATDTDTFSIVSKNGTINAFVRDEIWQAYTKTAFSTTSTSYVDAQSVTFETRFTGSRILALVSFDSTGTDSVGQMAVTFDGGAVDFEFTRTATGEVNDAPLVLPQLSGVLSKGSHTVAVRVKAESTRTFQGNVRITLLEVKSDMYLNSSSWTSTGTSIGSNDLGSMALTFSGTPSILAAGVFSHVGSVSGTYHIRNVPAAGAMGSFPETNYGANNDNTGSILTLVKSGGTNYPTSGNNIAFNVNFAAAETVSGRLYAIALPTSDITRFEDSIDVPGTVSGTTWVTRRSLSVTLAATADLYVFVSGHAALNGHRGRMRVLLDSVDVTDTILMHDSAVGAQPSANYGIVLPDVTSGTKSLELQFSTDNASGTATITSAVISALSVKTR
jgi:hypothetical protein